ncbi:hypothetical protein AAEU31_02355 [Pseudoalteromonas sp. SSMSWG5]|uniref:Type II toxin-antitoxin system HicA family toxin n=1 Tax=Pseudoalteromonas shioyasakiensis TaxID=1190813 RepID=A0ABT6TUN7_9GAMM|nr:MULTISPECIES: hypothetical protein [Pseudoalteromonas]MDI4667627.1 hypothetical protein [Pseudoalteromonas shioyasakiensis]MDI4673142.1 hypothetical protein [Pseudoalteromonas shioyasakiensis]MDI4685207.1 hypothetical protein [Pseudoalteromonas shioyasakiensis]MDI4705066.1 hypothetical protein [Pseudoalteromonas shioyasakiensis]NUJ20543.1 hypothetical protein [Pseudoalteromonas sp. 0802]
MKKYSSDKDINMLVRALLKKKGWSIRQGKHPKLITPSGFKVTVPSTPSDFRAFKNFKNDIRRLKEL